jgi:hypothetical protein
LTEDLRLADDERVQAGSDPEDVPDHVGAALLVKNVVGDGVREALGEGFLGDSRGLDRVGTGGVELDPIAGRYQQRFVEPPVGGNLAKLLLQAIRRRRRSRASCTPTGGAHGIAGQHQKRE